MSKYLTLNEVTQLLGVSSRTIRRYVNKGILTRTLDKGRCVFLTEEVNTLKDRKSKKGTLGVLYDRLGELNRSIIKLDIRVRVLELALSARQPDAVLSEDDIKHVRKEVKRVSRLKDIDYKTILSWSDDLLRLDNKTCKSIGVKLLDTFCTRLTLQCEASPEILIDPTKLITLDKLRIFKTRLNGYAAISLSEGQSHLVSEP